MVVINSGRDQHNMNGFQRGQAQYQQLKISTHGKQKSENMSSGINLHDDQGNYALPNMNSLFNQ